jgi:hypothetical protein
MTLGIITAIHQTSSQAYQRFIAGSRVEQWMGKGVVLIQVGSEKVSPYCQNRVIASGALIGYSALLMPSVAMLADKILDCMPFRAFPRVGSVLIGIALFSGGTVSGVTAFSKFTHQPFSKLATIAMVIAGGALGLNYAFPHPPKPR